MKFTRITPQNLPLIKFRIGQFIERLGLASETYHYRYAKMYNRMLNANRTEESMTYHFFSYNVEFEIDRLSASDDPFIRITSGKTVSVIKVGDKISITPSHIYIKNKNILHENEGDHLRIFK